MQYISTKALRQQFPEVRAALARGEEYLLIHRSQPIARLVPVDQGTRRTGERENGRTAELENRRTGEPAPELQSASAANAPLNANPPLDADPPHITTHVLHKPMTLPVPAGYSHPQAFKDRAHDHLFEKVDHLKRPVIMISS